MLLQQPSYIGVSDRAEMNLTNHFHLPTRHDF
jgi:hypothetical protein